MFTCSQSKVQETNTKIIMTIINNKIISTSIQMCFHAYTKINSESDLNFTQQLTRAKCIFK